MLTFWDVNILGVDILGVDFLRLTRTLDYDKGVKKWVRFWSQISTDAWE